MILLLAMFAEQCQESNDYANPESATNVAEERMLLIQEKMENAYPLKVILKVDIQKGSNWRQAH